jgi:hypothetical protein
VGADAHRSYKVLRAAGVFFPHRPPSAFSPGDDMPAGASKKRERQYEHIKESYEKRGQKGRAEEIAARTVNKERAESGEAKKSSSSRSSPKPSGKSSSSRSASKSSSSSKPSAKSSSSRSSSRAGSSSGGERSRAQLYEQAKREGIPGRSTMNKAQLERALSR